MSLTTIQPQADRQLSSMNVSGPLHLCNGLDPRRDGGMVPSILGMTGALARQGSAITIVTSTPSRLDGAKPSQGVALLGPHADLELHIRSAQLVHIHGLWQRQTRLGARLARQAKIPYLMTVHGMADPWALQQKALKKKVYTALIEGKNLRRASCLHALSRPEIGHLHSLAPKTPICLVPNGVDLRPFDQLPDRTVLESKFPVLVGKFILLFFGRFHTKKGLDLLPKALAAVASNRPELHIVMAGNDDGSLASFEAGIEALNLTDRVTIVGHVSGEQARSVWGAADAFILPSYSEGFSMAVLEALAARLPVVVTTACNFPELAAAEGGIVVEPTEAGVTSGLHDLLERSQAERQALAHRGRALVETEYSWDRQAERLNSVYRWVIGGGDTPEAVESARGLR